MNNKAKAASVSPAGKVRKSFLLDCWDSDTQLSRLGKEALRRYKEAIEEATLDDNGCLIAPSTKSDGYAQTKIRHLGDQFSPRTYTLEVLRHNRAKAEEAVRKDFSHICGRGHKGCINPKHIVLENHRINLERQRCHIMASCPQCNNKFPVFPCNHQPPCVRN